MLIVTNKLDQARLDEILAVFSADLDVVEMQDVLDAIAIGKRSIPLGKAKGELPSAIFDIADDLLCSAESNTLPISPLFYARTTEKNTSLPVRKKRADDLRRKGESLKLKRPSDIFTLIPLDTLRGVRYLVELLHTNTKLSMYHY